MFTGGRQSGVGSTDVQDAILLEWNGDGRPEFAAGNDDGDHARGGTFVMEDVLAGGDATAAKTHDHTR